MGAMNWGHLLPVSVGCVNTERQIACRAGHIHYMLKELCPTLASLSLCAICMITKKVPLVPYYMGVKLGLSNYGYRLD